MGNLRIRKVIYSGKEYCYESSILDKNIVLIEGDNGTGKSTLCNLIYFGLGGRVAEFRSDSDRKHKEITSDSDNYVELYVYISGEKYLLRRFLSENEITVIPFSEELITVDGKKVLDLIPLAKTEKTKVLALYRRETEPYIFSDWITEKIGISVVELFQGYKSFKVGFSDIMRLIYHDQQPDPEFIYKKLDTKDNYVSDSETLRKAIFELLVGKSFSDYYDAIVKFKVADKEKSLAKNLLDEYSSLADKLRGTSELKNKNFLQEEIQKKDSQLDRLQSSRSAFKRNRSVESNLDPQIASYKSNIIEMELQLSDLRENLLHLYDEKSKLISIKSDSIKDVEQIQKVIFTHDQLNLFSSDACPYCLTGVERAEGHCVCGAPIEEEQYERFFYTAQEYNEILKAKTKSLATIDLAIIGCNEDIGAAEENTQDLNTELPKLKEDFRSLLNRLDEIVDIETINDIDDKILEVREEIAHLYQTVEVESKLEKLQNDYDEKREVATERSLERKELEVKSQRDIASKVKAFSSIYNQLMVETLSECRSARIRLEDYLPSINDGEYREASARVSIRLMYYLTLMKLSLTEDDVTFPKFLLIDTPETAGIELENLINCISKFKELDLLGKDYQVILATGLGKYPESVRDCRVLHMPTKKDSLLKRRS